MKFNPFRPGSIVAPGMFSGRLEEIESIKRSLHQTKNGNPRHFLVEGERGIGKSSLMLIARAWASEKAREGSGFDFVPLEIELNESITYIELVRKIATALRSAMRARNHLQTKAKIVWEFLSKWSVLGVEFKGNEKALLPSEAVDQLAWTLANFMNQASPEIDGIIILIDEADKADPAVANLGEFAKTLTEKLTKLSCDRVCIALAGLPILVQKLREGHESSLRIFEILSLKPLSADEAEWVVHQGLTEANKKNATPTSIDADALGMITHLSEGYPHFIQQFSFCAFEQDDDNNIDLSLPYSRRQ